MYPRRAILDDARHHQIPILPLDINASDKPYTIEPVAHDDSRRMWVTDGPHATHR